MLPKYSTSSGSWIGTSTPGAISMTTQTAMPTSQARVSAPATKAATSSPADSGGIRISMIEPCILATRIDDDELAKAFWIMPMTISPGPRKSA